MMYTSGLERLLIETEKAHAASGHSAEDWARWYASYMLPKIREAFNAPYIHAL